MRIFIVAQRRWDNILDNNSENIDKLFDNSVNTLTDHIRENSKNFKIPHIRGDP